MVDLDAIVQQTRWDELALDTLQEGLGITRAEAVHMYTARSAKVKGKVLSFDYIEFSSGRMLRGEIEVKRG